MNRYKKFLRDRGFKLEDDFDCFPYNGIEVIKVVILKEGLLYRQYIDFYGWHDVLVSKYCEV